MHPKILLFFLLLTTCIPASAAKLYYGVAILDQEVNISLESASGTLEITEDGSGIGVFADMYHKGTYRFNGTFSYVDYTDFYITSLTASADYLIPIDATFTFFVGATAGVTGQVYNESSFSDMAMSYLAGAQLGGIMLAGDHLMIELGYRQRVTDLETELPNISAIATVDEMSETYISLNIIF